MKSNRQSSLDDASLNSLVDNTSVRGIDGVKGDNSSYSSQARSNEVEMVTMATTYKRTRMTYGGAPNKLGNIFGQGQQSNVTNL